MDKARVFQNPGKRLFKILAKDCSNSPEKSWHGSDPPLLGGAKIAAVVLHTMNIEGQIHQKNPGMGQTPPLSGNARILEAPVIATPPLVPNESNNDENSSYSMQ